MVNDELTRIMPHSSLITHHSSFIIHHSSFIIHHSLIASSLSSFSTRLALDSSERRVFEMWRRRDHERYIGGYDPEYEMPDPDRRPGDRWASDAYRHNSRDTRFSYRWDPDRIEERFGSRHPRDFRDI